MSALGNKTPSMRELKFSTNLDDRVWYDQFSSTDWVHDSIADAYRVKALRSRKDFRGRIQASFDGSQGWVLSALVGFLTATIAYCVDISEAPVFDWKDGYCSKGFLINEKVCNPYPIYIHASGATYVNVMWSTSLSSRNTKIPIYSELPSQHDIFPSNS